MGCDCNKTYSIGMGCCQPVLAPADNYYTKYQTELKIEEAVSGLTGSSSGCCITPEEVDAKISAATDGMATEQWVENKGYITGVDLSDYATLEDIPDLTDYALKSEIPSLSGYATEQWVENKNYLTEHQPIKTINGQSLIGTGDIEIGTGGTIDLSNYYTTAQTVNLVESAVTRVEGEMPTVPTSNTAFTNDAGYITECSGITSGEVQTMISQSVSGKVDNTTYTAYTASTQTTISSKADSSTLNNYLLKSKIWCGTQAEYDLIQNKDSETLYLIHS